MGGLDATDDTTSLEQGSAQDDEPEDSWTDDPRNPYNWSNTKKVYHTACVAFYAFTITYMSSAYAPGTRRAASDLGVSQTVSLLGVSIFCLGLSLGPVIGAPLSETAGRLVVYRFGLPIATLFIIGSALARNIRTIVVCRFLAGVFGSPALSVGGGSVADIWPPSQRGPSTVLFVTAPFLGPCIAPVIGGFVIEHLNWRWLEWVAVFWAMATCVFALGMCETYKPKILEHDASKEKLAARRGRIPVLRWDSLRKWIADSLLRPLQMFATEPIVLFLSLYVGFNFAVLYAFFASMPLVFRQTYNFTDHETGLVFLALGVGTILGTTTNILCDRFIYQRKCKEALQRGESDHLPAEQRLYPAMMGSVGVVVGLFWFAWTARSDVHWISPVLALIPFNWGNMCIFSSNMVYLIDCYGSQFGASALSANALTRYVLAAALPLVTIQMYDGLTTKWAASLLGFVALALVPIPWILFAFGPSIRKRSKYV
ncbi:Polyamine transporter 4 [Cladobotryum mycophilum]|uniref:Polyamine transporter 4 n=1 Tax=Cladobotryum mycophilum TaxID=491253 RepID=A0ABR0S893_9HYPO